MGALNQGLCLKAGLIQVCSAVEDYTEEVVDSARKKGKKNSEVIRERFLDDQQLLYVRHPSLLKGPLLEYTSNIHNSRSKKASLHLWQQFTRMMMKKWKIAWPAEVRSELDMGLGLSIQEKKGEQKAYVNLCLHTKPNSASRNLILSVKQTEHKLPDFQKRSETCLYSLCLLSRQNRVPERNKDLYEGNHSHTRGTSPATTPSINNTYQHRNIASKKIKKK